MGKWKYLNFLVVLVILIFMFGTLASRYNANTITYLSVICGIVLLTIAGTFIFVVKMDQQKPPSQDKVSNKSKDHMNGTKRKPRPKVVLKPRNKENE